MWGHLTINHINYINGKKIRNLTTSNVGKQTEFLWKNLCSRIEIITPNNFFNEKTEHTEVTKNQRKKTSWEFARGMQDYFNIRKSVNVIHYT